MDITNTTATYSECSECCEMRQVYCDSGYRDLPDGTTEHDTPICQECVEAERHASARAEAQDAYYSGRPMASDDY